MSSECRQWVVNVPLEVKHEVEYKQTLSICASVAAVTAAAKNPYRNESHGRMRSADPVTPTSPASTDVHIDEQWYVRPDLC